ncbi:MAG: septum formation protein Maf [Nannocystaceae bacterium]|nr:septum formation protein Maf [Nannocystaceae bacterium]
MPLTLVLASTSKYRKELLGRLDVDFVQAAPTYDEDADRGRFDELADEAFALEMALRKAESLASSYPAHLILAADQIAVLPGPPRQLLCKPGTEAAAVEQLLLLSGTSHRLTTGVVLYDTRSSSFQSTVDRQTLTMRAFDRDEATRYIARHRPLDCVGSYRIEDAGIALFESIDTKDYTGIIGLPLLAVARLLRAAGVL